MSFPEILDHACVLYYTPQACYGAVYDTAGEIADPICYLAICKYKNDTEFYLFGCNADYEVVSDSLCGSVEECMFAAESSYAGEISWIAME